MKSHFPMFAAYNRWANERIYAAAGALSPADFRADHGAFFGSLNGTLNHLVVTDRIWLRRFTGDGPLQTRLDEILTDDIASLHGLRRAEDARLIFYVDGPTEAAIAGPLSYTPISKPIPVRQPLGTVLAHLFNHQTHHRGQATAILTRIGGRDACESLDLAMFQRQTGVGL